MRAGDPRRLGEVGCRCGRESDGFVDVATDGGRAGVESGGRAGVGVAATQTGQDRQCLASGGECASPAADPSSVCGQLPGKEAQV
ncbi:hypothetical protein GCM10010428_78610 [Actinosynnema pretiosum subsp. pretiosum]